MREIYRQAGLTNTEEQPDPPAQTSTSTSTMSQTITLPSGAVMSLVNKATEVDCFGSSTSQHGTVVTTVKSMASQSSCMAASSASGTSVNPSTVSQLTGQRHEAAGVQAGIVGPGTSAGVKEEPRVLYSRRPEEQGRNVRVVQVKQESVEYNCAGNLESKQCIS